MGVEPMTCRLRKSGSNSSRDCWAHLS